MLQVAVDADALASASNASMDTYDSGPVTLEIERWVVRALATMAGFGPSADGVLTPGGSISNLLAVLIAAHVSQDGESTWFEGVQLLAVYVVLGIVFFFA